MRTHTLKITDFQGGSIPTGSHQNKKDTHKECYLDGAFRESGILAGEEMIQEISTTSVIRSNVIPSAKQVRECGARVIYAYKIPLVLRVLWNISALPQYLERFAARYANPLRVCKYLQICACRHGASGFEFVRSTNKKKQTPTSECLFLFVGDPYGNRTHVFSVRG